MSPTTTLLLLALTVQVPAPDAAEKASAALRATRQKIDEDERARLKPLAGRRAEPAPPTLGASRFVPLPELVPGGRGLANVPATAKVAPEVVQARDLSVDPLFALAKKAVALNPKHYALADECLRAVLERRPDHPEARRLLGFVPHEGGWATPFAVRQLKLGNVLHPTYGWVPKAWVEHLEKGELPAPSQRSGPVHWLPADEADRQHASWDKAWKIPTEHFLVRSNVPLSEAIAFSRRLEDFHQLFFALLADVFDDKLPLAQRFASKTMVGEPTTRPHEVYYYASKAEYADALTPIEGPSVGKSLGIYLPPKGKEKRGRAYFFRDEGGQLPVEATLYHEVSHQLLFESNLGDPEAYRRNDGNYWVFEGLGTYFETLERTPDGALEVGGLVGPRILVAIPRLTEQGEAIPLAEFVTFDQSRFNAEKRVYLHYQEANALAVFFMQAGSSQYRDGFLEYVADAAKGRLRRGLGRSLEDRIGVPYPSLDAEFLAYLKQGPKR